MKLCGACGLDFTSVQGFDAHRVGKHAYTYSEGSAMDPPREDGRRCLTVGELPDKGFRHTGSGLWELAASADRARERFPTRRTA